MTNELKSNPRNAKNIALWTLQALTAAAFLAAGFAKLMGQPMMVEIFEKVGLGQWFRYVTGAIEIGSAILLLVPRLTPLAAALLLCTMTGAVLAHVLTVGGSAAPAFILGCFAALILWGRRASVKAWFASVRARCASAVHEPVAAGR